MTINERIIQAATPVVPVCVPDVYAPNEGEEADVYCTFNSTRVPEGFGNNRPRAVRHLVQLHFYYPLDTDPLETIGKLEQAIGTARGFTWPTVTPATDLDGGHHVFEFEALEGIV